MAKSFRWICSLILHPDAFVRTGQAELASDLYFWLQSMVGDDHAFGRTFDCEQQFEIVLNASAVKLSGQDDGIYHNRIRYRAGITSSSNV